MARLNPEESFDTLKTRVKEEIKSSFPVESDSRSLTVEDVEFDDQLDSFDMASQKDAKLKGQTWGIPVKAKFVLKDKATGETIRESTIKVATLPKITSRYSNIVNGAEYQVDNQWRLKPGVYTRIRSNGELESRFNFATQRPLNMTLDPQSRIFRLEMGGSKPQLYPILKAVGMSDSDLEKSWGKEILEANKITATGRKLNLDTTAIKFAKKVAPLGKDVNNIAEAGDVLRNYFQEAKLDPSVTKLTLGQEFDHISGAVVAKTSARLLGVARGDQPDTRDSLEFKELLSTEDFVGEKIKQSAKIIQRRIKNNIDRKDRIGEIVGPDIFDKPIREFFTKTTLSSTPPQTNPLEVLSNQQRTTITGEGGVSDANKITEEAKLVDPSHFGFLDALHTPECHSGDTLVQTRKGWERWDQVSNDAEFACCVEGRLEFHKASVITREDYKGLMYGANSTNVSYLVTPNHRMICMSPSKEWVIASAEEMHGRLFMMPVTNPPYLGDPEWCLKSSFVLPVMGNELDVLFWAKSFGRCLGGNLEAGPTLKDARIPEFFLHCSMGIRHNLLEGLLPGFGVDLDRLGVFRTINRKLADDVEQLVVSLGHPFTHQVIQGRRYRESYALHEIRLSKQITESISGTLDQFTREYEGIVYCATVKGGMLRTRRDDKGPIWSGNSAKTGVSLHLALSATKEGREVKLPLFNLKTRKREFLSPEQVRAAVVAMPDEGDWTQGTWVPKGSTVKASAKGNEINDVSSKDVQYVMESPSQMFSLATNLVPFLSSDSPNRSTMAGRHMEQAISLRNREAPLVQSGRFSKVDTFDELVGTTASHKSPISGQVTKISKDSIEITDQKGVVKKVGIYDHYPVLEKKSMIHSEPVVKEGDQVKAGDLIADTNFSRNGVYAPGTNLITAFAPWRGLNFEDSVVISQSAAEKLRSDHLLKKSISTNYADLPGKNKFLAYHATSLTPDQVNKLGKDGIVEVGQEVYKGDTLIAAMKESAPTTEAQMLSKLKKSLVKPYSNRSVTWSEDTPGKVVGVYKHGKSVQVHVTSSQAMEEGDKLAGRHGNKGVVGRILPDHEMPTDESGRPVEVLFNPIGIAGRMNTGQVMETAAGKIAQKTGKPYKVINFSQEDARTQVQNELKAHGLKDKETLTDPATGKEIPNILVGPQYFLKLQHQVDKKLSARSRGGYDRNLIPKGGGPQGGQALGALGIYAMLAHGAKCFVGETRIQLANGSDMPIEEIAMTGRRLEIPIEVWSYSEAGKWEAKRVSGWSTHAVRRSDLIQLKFGCIYKMHKSDEGNKQVVGSFTVTATHEIYTGRGKLPAEEIKIADCLTSSAFQDGPLSRWGNESLVGGIYDSSPMIVLGNARLEGDDLIPVYNIEVEDNHNYLAEGILVGNSNLREMSTLKCFLADTMVDTDHGIMKIGDIVEEQKDVKVLSYDPETKKLSFQPILNYWKRSFDAEPLVELLYTYQAADGSLMHGMVTCTEGHEIYTTNGWKVRAKDAFGEMLPWRIRLSIDRVSPDQHIADASHFEIREVKVTGIKLSTWRCVSLYNLEVAENHNYFANGILVGNSDRDQADDLWAALQAGEPIPPPKPTFAYDKFTSYLTGMGINVTKEGNSLNLTPLTDKQVLEMSNGELKDAGRMIKGYKIGSKQQRGGIEPEKSGLFDPRVTGGLDGGKWCLAFSSRVITDQGPIVIGRIVKQKLKVKVLTLSKEGELEYQPITNYWENNTDHDLIKLIYNTKDYLRGYGNFGNPRYLWCTPNHTIHTPEGEFQAGEMDGREVIIQLDDLLSPGEPKITSTSIIDIDRSGTDPISKQHVVYNIGVAKNHNYFVEGILVGNSHIRLSESVPNPVFEKAIRNLTDLTGPKYDQLIAGELAVTKEGAITQPGIGTVTGPKAVKQLLESIDVAGRLKTEEGRVKGLKGTDLNKVTKRVKYLRNLQRLDMSPTEAYMMQNVPVLPPKMRPLSILDDGTLQFEDINQIYKEIAILNKSLADFPDHAPDSVKNPLRKDIQDRMRALTGMGGTLKGRFKGIADVIAGDSPKLGFVQDKLIKRKQDLTLRSTIIPEPNLSLDEVEIPRKAALELYKPFVIREIKQSTGTGPLQARRMVEENHPIVSGALDRVVAERPIIIKRDPVLHKHGIQAFQPKLTEGRAIKIHPLICSGFNADFDGNCISGLSRVTLTVEVESGINSNNLGVLDMLKGKCNLIVRGTSEEALVSINIEDFPHSDLHIRDKNGNPVYAVPAGIKILSYDHCTGRAVFTKVTGFTVEENCLVCEVTTRRKRSVTVSNNESLCIYDHETGQLRKQAPSDSIGMLMPRIKKIPMKHEVDYGYEFGWAIGAFVSDGSFNGKHGSQIQLSKVDEEYRERFYGAVCSRWDGEGKPPRQRVFTDYHDGSHGVTGASIRITIIRVPEEVLSVFRGCYLPEEAQRKGRSALNKKLPDDIICMSLETRLGILSGLLDGDGHLSWNRSRSQDQLVAQVQTSSYALRDTVLLLCQTLGIRASFTKSPPKPGRLQTHTAYTVNLSTVDLYGYADQLQLLGNSARALEEFLADPPSKDDNDIVPVPLEIMTTVASAVGPMAGHRSQRSLAVIKSRCKGKPYISRALAKEVLPFLDLDDPIPEEWAKIVQSKSMMWDVITEVEIKGKETVYDLVVPATKIFATDDGLVVWDTMSAYVPVSDQAVAEARKMFPSNILFNEATGGVMYSPSHESQVGLYTMSEIGKKTNKRYKDQDELDQAVQKKEIGEKDVANVGGVKTTWARTQIDRALPEEMRGGSILTDLNFQFNKKEQGKMFQDMAHKDGRGFAKRIDKMKDMGNEAATFAGFSFGLDDFKTQKDIRDPIMKDAAKKTRGLNLSDPVQLQTYTGIYDKAITDMDSALVQRAKDTADTDSLSKLEVAAGIKGKGYRQLRGAPVMFIDAKGDLVTSPVSRSYAEGLKSADYWAASSGGRKGVIQKVQSVAEPGYLTKMMMNSTVNQMIATEDCETDRGISLPTSETDVIGRHLAAALKVNGVTLKRGELITSQVMQKIKNAGISKVVVRSPMRCAHTDGVCKKSMHPATQVIIRGQRGDIVAGNPIQVSLEKLFSSAVGEIKESEDGGQIKTVYGDLTIWDDHQWVTLERVLRHPREPGKKLLQICTKVGNTHIVTEDHECVISRSDHPQSVRADQVKVGDRISLGVATYQAAVVPKVNPYLLGMLLTAETRSDGSRIELPVPAKFPGRGKMISLSSEWGMVIITKNSISLDPLPLLDHNIDFQDRVLPPDFNGWDDEYSLQVLAGIIDASIAGSDQKVRSITITHPSLALLFQLQTLCAYFGVYTGTPMIVKPGGPYQLGLLGTESLGMIPSSFLKQVSVRSELPPLGSRAHGIVSGVWDVSDQFDISYVYDVTTSSSTFTANGMQTHNCYGHGVTGEPLDLGTNVGVQAAQAIGERGTQLSMRSFHSGGIWEGEAAAATSLTSGGFDRALTILHMPKKVKGSATLATRTGSVEQIESDPAGGKNVIIDGTRHYIPANRKDMDHLRVGAQFKKGDPLTRGPINPHEMLPLTNMNRVQSYLASELHGIYGDLGIKRRNSEVMVRALSDVTKIEDQGDHPSWMIGDFVPTTEVNQWNKQTGEQNKAIGEQNKKGGDRGRKPGKVPVAHSPVLKGVRQIPEDVQTDWLARLNHEGLKGTLVEAAQQGWTSQLHGTHPIPPLIYGAEFGIGTKDKPWSY